MHVEKWAILSLPDGYFVENRRKMRKNARQIPVGGPGSCL